MVNDHKQDMLIHKVLILLALVLVSYLSAVPVLLHGQRKSNKEENLLGSTQTVLTSSTSNSTNFTNHNDHTEEQDGLHLKEPWEVNQGVLQIKGVE